jgi:glycosyltransferase involved in cell wall biosynthesis
MQTGKLRILLIAHGHPDFSIGGGELAAYALFRHLRSLPDVDATFMAWTPSGDPSGPPTVTTHRDRPDEFLFRARGFDGFLLSYQSEATNALVLAIGALEPHVVHLHHYINVGIELLGELRRLDPALKIFVTLHEYRAICHHHGLMVRMNTQALCERADNGECAACFPGTPAAAFARRRLRLRHYLGHADRLLAPSRFLRRRYVEWGMNPRRILVMENGVEPATACAPLRAIDSEPASDEPPQNDFPSNFGFFGQIHPYKGLHCLLEAFDRAALEMPEIRLSIHGAHFEANDPGYIALINGLVDRQRERIRFLGPYRRGDIGALMQAVDWVIVPSLWWENAPLVIEEALSYGRPVLCSAAGGMREKVRSAKDGFHFDLGDSAALASLMLRVGRDRKLWQGLRKTMRKPLSTAESAERHLQLYRTPRGSHA